MPFSLFPTDVSCPRPVFQGIYSSSSSKYSVVCNAILNGSFFALQLFTNSQNRQQKYRQEHQHHRSFIYDSIIAVILIGDVHVLYDQWQNNLYLPHQCCRRRYYHHNTTSTYNNK